MTNDDRIVDKANQLLDTALEELQDMIVGGTDDSKLIAVRALMPMLKEKMQGEEESEMVTKLRETQAEFFAEVREYLIADHLVIEDLPSDTPIPEIHLEPVDIPIDILVPGDEIEDGTTVPQAPL